LVCSWEDNLEAHEKPPKRIWLDPKALKEWFDHVKAERKREAEGKGRRDIEDPQDNDAAKGLVSG
jgi:hypothetical protein